MTTPLLAQPTPPVLLHAPPDAEPAKAPPTPPNAYYCSNCFRLTDGRKCCGNPNLHRVLLDAD